MRSRVLGGLAAAIGFGLLDMPASAQTDLVDWDLTRNAETGMVAASTTFSSGITIALRCVNAQYDALIGGLPAVPEGIEQRTLSLQFGDEPQGESYWYVGTHPTVAVSNLPAPLARSLREGGIVRLRLQEPGEGGRRLRYDLHLPASAANIDRTLTACDRPTVDPRDALIEELPESGLPSGVEWARPPRPRYPEGRTFERGFVTVSCLNRSDGELEDCVVESEYPLNGGFGEEALLAARRGRIRLAADHAAPLPARMVVFRNNFAMESVADAAIRGRSPTRIPRQSEP